jgi:Glycosyl transferases, related to UDP-glucuronosyltransferase
MITDILHYNWRNQPNPFERSPCKKKDWRRKVTPPPTLGLVLVRLWKFVLRAVILLAVYAAYFINQVVSGTATIAAGLKAGVSSIIVPFSNDQFAWGCRVYELGVGSKPIPRKKLNRVNLSAGIEFVLTEEINDTTRQLGSRIQSENGCATAARVILDSLDLCR